MRIFLHLRFARVQQRPEIDTSKLLVEPEMDETLFQWLKDNEGRTFNSPRKDVFGRNPKSFTINSIDENKKAVRVKFEGSKYPALPLYFTMFDRVLEYLRTNPTTTYPIGARLQPPYPKESIEGEIWRDPKPYSTEYKSSPHVLDILVHTGLAKYAYTKSRDSGRKVQGAQYDSEQTPPTQLGLSSIKDEKNETILTKLKKTWKIISNSS